MKQPPRKRPPKVLYALFDAAGEPFGTYESRQEAEDDVWGPRFRDGHTIRVYELATRKREKELE